MTIETMTSAERVATALAFEKPDRVPVVPFLCKSTAANYCGVSRAQVERDLELGLQCMLRTFDDVGGWDALNLDMPDTALANVLLWQQPLEWKVPGVDLPEDAVLQCHEREVMTVEDYDKVIEEGFAKFYYDDLIYRIYPLEPGSVAEEIRKLEAFYGDRCVPEWESRGVAPYLSSVSWCNHPFFELCLARSFTKFTEDLFYRPELVEKALGRMADEWIGEHAAGAKEAPEKCAYLVEERASAFYYPLSVFERFWWPLTVKFVNAMWSEGAVTVMHLDNDWSKNLPYWKRDLPRGSYMIQLDGTTDIFAAKNLLQGHAMFCGDLPASLQALGSTEAVEGYCKRLIDEVGYEGGYFLTTGCDTAPDCKPENLRAMVQTGKTYEFSRR
jgi:uroporphyrinogen-III decarboxylase